MPAILHNAAASLCYCIFSYCKVKHYIWLLEDGDGRMDTIIEAPVIVLIMLASPIVLLILTYWFCILAQLPVNAEFDPTIPYEIKEAFNAGLKVKNRRFSIARYLTLFSALLLSSALFSMAFVKKKTTNSLDVSFNSDNSVLVVSGLFPTGIEVLAEIDSLNSKDESVRFYTEIFKIQETGILNLNIPMKQLPKEITVSTKWTEKKIKKGITRSLTK
jgi:hypothetical protein